MTMDIEGFPVMAYNPQRFMRQFGLDQDVPKPVAYMTLVPSPSVAGGIYATNDQHF